MKTLSLILAAGVSALAFASAAQASDLIVAEPAPMVGMVQATGNWDGPFVGVFGGGALGSLELPATGIPFSINPEGWTLGVDAGFNFALGNGLVLGLVGDLAWADISDDLGVGGVGSGFTSTIDWTGSLRARIGWDAGNYMPYLTAGLAAAHNTIDVTGTDTTTDPPTPISYSDDQIHVGWTIGAGVEFAVADNLSIDVGYRYNDYGSATYSAPTGVPGGLAGDLGLTSHQLTVGLHYGF